MNSPSVSILVAVVAVAGGVLAWSALQRRQRLRRFEDRDSLTIEQIYSAFFAEKGIPRELFCELWSEIARTLRLPAEKLRPTDRFDKELAPVKGWELFDEIEDIRLVAENRMDWYGCDADFTRIETVGDYIQFFCDPRMRQLLRGPKRRPREV